MSKVRTIRCEKCQTKFKTYLNEIKRGHAQCCSKMCAGHFKHRMRIGKICKICGTRFETYHNDREFCSIECQDEFNLSNG